MPIGPKAEREVTRCIRAASMETHSRSKFGSCLHRRIMTGMSTRMHAVTICVCLGRSVEDALTTQFFVDCSWYNGFIYSWHLQRADANCPGLPEAVRSDGQTGHALSATQTGRILRSDPSVSQIWDADASGRTTRQSSRVLPRRPWSLPPVAPQFPPKTLPKKFGRQESKRKR
jgi:hypothetical protein